VKSFGFTPIFVLVDELPSLRGNLRELDKKDKGSTFDWMLTDLLAKGRQCRIHVMVISQSLYVDSLPSAMQTNITRTVFLGPVDSRSLMSDDITEAAKQRVVSLSSRIPESAKGRGVFLARGTGGTEVIQFQSYFGYSPGNTALDAAPTPEMRQAWEKAKQVSEQMP
jgi:DNA segregation ATPase FtsK/SpoIIIE-like protein